MLNLSNFVILLQQPLGSLPRPGQLNTASLFPIASYQAASPWGYELSACTLGIVEQSEINC